MTHGPAMPENIVGPFADQMRLALVWAKLIMGEDLNDDRNKADPTWTLEEAAAKEGSCEVPLIAMQVLMSGSADGPDLVAHAQRLVESTLRAVIDDHDCGDPECAHAKQEITDDERTLIGTKILAGVIAFLGSLRDANTRALQACTFALHQRPDCEVSVIDTTGKTKAEVRLEIEAIKAAHEAKGLDEHKITGATPSEAHDTVPVEEQHAAVQRLAAGRIMGKMLGAGRPLPGMRPKTDKPEIH